MGDVLNIPAEVAVTMCVAEEQYPQPNREFMLEALHALIEPDDVVELRALHPAVGGGKKIVSSGFYSHDHWPQLTEDAQGLNMAGAQVYVTINPVETALLARSPNCMKRPAGKTTADGDITRRRWLPVDVDPVRPTNTSATEEQRDAAFRHAMKINVAMKARGWPSPVEAESGNGMHLLYAIDLPNDAESKTVTEGVLAGFAGLFDTDVIKVDRSVGNAARIMRLYGTVASKGEHTANAPHRLSALIAAPPRVVVRVDQLREIAALAPAKAQAQPATVQREIAAKGALRQSGSFKVETFLAKHGMKYSQAVHEGSEVFKLAHCPFNAEHKDGEAAVFRTATGVLGFKCFHNSCGDKHWSDVRDLLDGPCPVRRDDVEPQIDIAACQEAERLRMLAGEGTGPSITAAVVAAPGAASEATDEDDGLSDLSHAPVFDYGMCPGVLGRFIKSETALSEAPAIGILAGIVTRLSADVGRSCYLQVGHEKRHLRINWLTAGPTALGRKGTAAGIAELLRQRAFGRQESSTLEPALMKPARRETSLSTGEGLMQMLRTTKNVKDAERFVPPGLQDNRLLIDAAEFSGVLKKASGKEATLSERLREAYDGVTLSNTSAGNPMQAERPHIVVSAAVPDSELVKLMAGDSAVEATNGLINRFVVTYQVRDRIIAEPRPGAAHVFDQMADSYRLAVETAWGTTCAYRVDAECSIELTISADARACYNNWYMEGQARSDANYIRSLMAREANVLRIYAAMVALLRGSTCTEVADVEAAKLLLKYWRNSLEFIFSQGVQTAEAQKMEAAALKLLAKIPTHRAATTVDLKHTPTAERKRLIDWMMRQSPPWVSVTRTLRPDGRSGGTVVTRLR